MDKSVTVILTSCGRFDLLRRTIESFLLHNTYPVKEFIVYEDSGINIPKELETDFPFIKWIWAAKRYGQIAALDFLWQQVTTEYAAQWEDDWLTERGGFIEASMAILEAEPKIMQVWLQPLEDNNVHPVRWFKEYGLMAPLHSALRFNPSLKRKSDYDLIAPFSKHTTWNPAKPWKCEADIAKVYNDLGFRAAILPERYVRHIGENRRVKP